MWGIDPFWGLPHNPRTEWYRGLSRRLDEDIALFEFVVPMFPSSWLDHEVVGGWERGLGDGDRPTALAVGFLAAKEPAVLDELEVALAELER